MKYPLFITGPSSGGTHLLATMLDSHPEIAAGPELSLLQHKEVYADWQVAQDRLRDALKRTWSPARRAIRGGLGFRRMAPPGVISTAFRSIHGYGLSPKDIGQRLTDAHSLRELIDGIGDHFLEYRGKTSGIWIEKTLSNVFRHHEILEIWPEARFIVLARDGRDSCSSVIRRGSEPLPAYGLWLARLGAASNLADRKNVYVLKYEDLVSDLKKNMRSICDFIGVSFDESVLNPELNEYWKKQSQYHKTWSTTPTSGAISTKSIGKYRERLTPEQLSLFWAVALTRYGVAEYSSGCRDTLQTMDTYGYSVDIDEEWKGLDGFSPMSAQTLRTLASRLVEVRSPE